jgi:hypothetical protein
MKTYQLSSTGRRTTLILLLGAMAIWGFALWSFRSTLGISYNPLSFWPTLSASLAGGLSIGELVPALLMLVLIVATPLLIWNLLEEWAASYTPTEEGLRYTSLGIDMLYPWHDMQDVRRVDDDSDEPLDEVRFASDHTGQIGNPVVRFLHAQAYGRKKLPVYPGLEERERLIAEIRQHVETVSRVSAAPEGATASATQE